MTRAQRASLGVVISASHNPFPDNGIKFFSAQGTKLPDEWEIAVDAVTLKGDRCVYDFLYVAPVDQFEAGRPEFQAFVESLAVESGGRR